MTSQAMKICIDELSTLLSTPWDFYVWLLHAKNKFLSEIL